jgi:hypothetical protein
MLPRAIADYPCSAGSYWCSCMFGSRFTIDFERCPACRQICRSLYFTITTLSMTNYESSHNPQMANIMKQIARTRHWLSWIFTSHLMATFIYSLRLLNNIVLPHALSQQQEIDSSAPESFISSTACIVVSE